MKEKKEKRKSFFFISYDLLCLFLNYLNFVSFLISNEMIKYKIIIYFFISIDVIQLYIDMYVFFSFSFIFYSLILWIDKIVESIEFF